jgi:hypothetical protein
LLFSTLLLTLYSILQTQHTAHNRSWIEKASQPSAQDRETAAAELADTDTGGALMHQLVEFVTHLQALGGVDKQLSDSIEVELKAAQRMLVQRTQKFRLRQ